MTKLNNSDFRYINFIQHDSFINPSNIQENVPFVLDSLEKEYNKAKENEAHHVKAIKENDNVTNENYFQVQAANKNLLDSFKKAKRRNRRIFKKVSALA